MDPDVTDDVAAATVLLSALITQTENDTTTEYKQCFLGSGSVVSPDGRYILTNNHVVSLVDLATSYADETEASALEENPGRLITVQFEEIIVSVVDYTNAFPDRKYRAEVVKQDAALDLALLRITGDSPGLDHERRLLRPHLSLDFGAVQAGHPVTLVGYPAFAPLSTDEPGCAPVPADRSIQLFPGVVSGLAGPNLDRLVVTASGSGGMSGGSAVNAAGHLIGIPAEIQQMAAGGVVEVIPVERAQDFLEEIVTVASPTPLATDTPTSSPTASLTPPPADTETATTTATTTVPTPTAALSGNLAYGVEIAGQWDIYAYDFASGTSTPLAADPTSDELAPSHSHDGSRIAYVSDANGSSQAWVMDADGANPIQVTDGPAEISYVAWTADDESLIVTAEDEASDGYLAVIPVTGGNLRTFGPPGTTGFATVADDGRAAFVQFRQGDHDVLIADPTGMVIVALAETGEEEDAPNISPDGSRLAYQVGLQGARRIEIVSTQGGPVERVGPNSRDDSNPVWSPDGVMLAHAAASGASTEGNADEIWVVRPGNGQPTRLDLKLPPFDQLWYLTWGPSPRLTPRSPARSVVPTSTPSPVPFTPTPSPTPAVSPSLTSLFPDVLPLVHASCFEVESEGEFTLEGLAGRFPRSEEAAAQLRGWGWQASADRAFGCDDPPMGEAGYVYISLHHFADSASAQEAVDYFAESLAEDTMLARATAPGVGDYAAALSGPMENGKDFTLYTSTGPLLIRVTGVSPSGIPMRDVLTVAEAMLAAQQGTGQAVTLPLESASSGPASTYLPTSPAVSYAECFSILSEGPYSYSEVASALQTWGLTQAEIDTLGWQDGAYRGFTCDDPPEGGATQMDVVIHRFRDAQAAQRAAPYFAGTYGMGTNEARNCDTAGSLVLCVTARSLTGSPLSDVQLLLQQIVAAARQ
jgi:S1-C subfamily serine protease